MSRYVREKQKAKRWDGPRHPRNGFVACASCGARSEAFLVIYDPIAGQEWPPFPVCRACYSVYRASPTRAAADRFVLDMVGEMARRMHMG